MTELKPCPFRVHGERTASLTIPGEFYYNELFMPCMREECACFYRIGNELRCMRDNTYLVLGEEEDGKGEGE